MRALKPTARLFLASVVVGSLLITGCTLRPGKKEPYSRRYPVRRPTSLYEERRVVTTLYRQYREWDNVRYRKGGLSKSGIDCSGFVYLTFLKKFDIRLPRTTKQQARTGKKISLKKLKAGDLVFFKTGFFSRHVGIYVEGTSFLHVSSSKGVTLSNLRGPYWSKKYWHARRIRT